MKITDQSKIVILSHFTYKTLKKGAGAPHNIRNYLLPKVKEIYFIEQPFPNSNYPYCDLTVYKNGKLAERLISIKNFGPILFMFIFQFIQNIIFLLKQKSKFDVCFALDNLSMLSMLPLRKLGIIKYLIYYTIDYSPKRYNNPLLNRLFHILDKHASIQSDINWVTADNIIEAKKDNGIPIDKCSPYLVVPIGFDASLINTKPQIIANRFKLVFVGVLYQKQGLQMVINTLPRLIKVYPKIKMEIIGSGDYRVNLEDLVAQKGLTKYVKFYGFITDHHKVTKILTQCGIGLATYDPFLGDFTYFADPSKIKIYLMCGLPVITSTVPEIGKYIVRKKAGIIAKYNEESIFNSINKLMSSSEVYKSYRTNAFSLSKDFDIKLILDKALAERE